VSDVQHKMIHDGGDDYRDPYELRVRPATTDPRAAIVSIESGRDHSVIVLEDQQRRDLIVALGGTP
jgi:hypothetical protein